ncbi:hypothetical protein BX070DRAFT_125778 [Coemansia spiralis]|nr:hypothetical protein BX070DRAFT_125778 [Coemansia spiralis]
MQWVGWVCGEWVVCCFVLGAESKCCLTALLSHHKNKSTVCPKRGVFSICVPIIRLAKSSNRKLMCLAFLAIAFFSCFLLEELKSVIRYPSQSNRSASHKGTKRSSGGFFFFCLSLAQHACTANPLFLLSKIDAL